jgi:hypothetical protein
VREFLGDVFGGTEAVLGRYAELLKSLFNLAMVFPHNVASALKASVAMR